jgi:transposase-like protein
MGRRADHTTEQRVEIVLALLRREEPASVLARRHGISEQTLYRWRDAFIAGGTSGLVSGRPGDRRETHRLAALEGAMAERDRVIGELTIANRILKKSDRHGS